MGAVIGVYADSGDRLTAIVDAMSKALAHRGSVSQLETIEDRKGVVTLGCLHHEDSTHEIARSRIGVAVLNGSFYGKRRGTNAKHMLRQVNSLSTREAIREAVCEIGGFAGLLGQKNALHGFRDVNGLKPLYYMRSSHFTAFASERKALWRVGLSDPQAVPPGWSVGLTRRALTRTSIVRFPRPTQRKIAFRQASSTLRSLLATSVRRVTRRAGRTCVAFSGGLDSALTAAVAIKLGVTVEGISVGLPGSPEIMSVEKFADKMGLRITLETFASDSLEEYVRRVLWLIEEPNMMKLSVAIPLHWAAKVAAERGYETMLCGQGSDELYGGYNKYAATLRLRGRKALSDQLYESVIDSSKVNYERDDQATSPFAIELRTPFADPDLIRFSLTIPSEFKVKDGNDEIRKWILRDVARGVGLPEDIVWRRKKAIQHGTGVEKAIIKLAKAHGQGPEEYLSKTFQEVKMMETMP